MAELIPAVKGTRDFYPDDYARITWLQDAWRRVSLRHGFREFEGPTLEYVELYTRKSGDEIVEQLFSLTDRGGRNLAMRPEMTPTLARMVAARAGSLPKPIKWFCMPRLFRGERPQRGRLREFFQWNVDLLGVPGIVADAECILAAVDLFREVGLAPADVAMHINDRRLVAALLAALGVAEDRIAAAYAILDRVGKLPIDEVERRWDEAMGGQPAFKRLWSILSTQSLADLRTRVERDGLATDALLGAVSELARLFEILSEFDIGDYCLFDVRIVRGLAYYTGPVFEAYDRGGKLRAICGGGRYDQLLELMGGRPLPAVGFGMGDVVLLELLSDLKRTPAIETGGGVVVADARAGRGSGAPHPSTQVLRITAALRRAGLPAEFAYEPAAIGKQLARGAERQARWAVIVGDETVARGVVQLKDLGTGRQREVQLDALLYEPANVLKAPP